MKSKIVKRILSCLLILMVLFSLVMVSPRLWSVIFPEKPPVGYHFFALDYLAVGVGLEHLINRNPEVPADIEEIKNIEYKNIDGKSLQLDIYKPKNLTKPAQLLVFIHGGGWKSGDRADYKVYLVAFAKKGYVTSSVSYRLIGDSIYPACIEDISDAVQWFFKNGERYGYDTDKIALIGGSAGGHLSLLAGYGWHKHHVINDITTTSAIPHRIKAIVDLYGPVDLTTEYTRNHPLVTNFLGHSYTEEPKLFSEASPNYYLDKNDPPTLIFQGTSDELVPVSQSDNLKVRLDSLGVPAVYYRLPLWPHAMDVIQRVNDFCQLKMNAFFEQYLKK